MEVYLLFFKGVPLSVYRMEERERLKNRLKELRKDKFDVIVHRAIVQLKPELETNND